MGCTFGPSSRRVLSRTKPWPPSRIARVSGSASSSGRWSRMKTPTWRVLRLARLDAVALVKDPAYRQAAVETRCGCDECAGSKPRRRVWL